LTDGVDVMRVYANGKTKKCFLTLSDDNFTLYVTSDKYKKSKGFFRRKTENKDERAIDIGAIDRIQRGHATNKFELARYVLLYARIFLFFWKTPTLLFATRARTRI
jgi:hypothetical protein